MPAMNRIFRFLLCAVVFVMTSSQIFANQLRAETDSTDLRSLQKMNLYLSYEQYKELPPFYQGLYDESIREVILGYQLKLEERKSSFGLDFITGPLLEAFAPSFGLLCEQAEARGRGLTQQRVAELKAEKDAKDAAKAKPADKGKACTPATAENLCGGWELPKGKACNNATVRQLMVDRCKESAKGDAEKLKKCNPQQVSACKAGTVPCQTDWFCERSGPNPSGAAGVPFCARENSGTETYQCSTEYGIANGIPMGPNQKRQMKNMVQQAQKEKSATDQHIRKKCTLQMSSLVLNARSSVPSADKANAVRTGSNGSDEIYAYEDQQVASLKTACGKIEEFVKKNKFPGSECYEEVKGLKVTGSENKIGALFNKIGASNAAYKCVGLPNLSADTCAARAISDPSEYNEFAKKAAKLCTCNDAAYCSSFRNVIAYSNFIRGVAAQEELKDSKGKTTELNFGDTEEKTR